MGDRCLFVETPDEPADLIISIDSFEHFADPAAILSLMYKMLAPGGKVLASFGPTWYHPKGGHLFSVRPWAHLMFSEKALIRWRNDVRSDGATRFSEVEGGLNQMTIGRFERLVAGSLFELDRLEAVPIRSLALVHNRLTREFCTAIVETPTEPADLIISLDSFEHFGDPAGILSLMYQMLAPGGKLLVSFGRTWYHPLAAICFPCDPGLT